MWEQSSKWYNFSMSQTYSVDLGDRGRLVLPAPLRRYLDLHPGDRLIITLDPAGGFHVVSAREQARRLQGVFRDRHPNRSPVEELIADRREEALREAQGQ